MALPLLRVGKGCHPAAGRMDRLVRSGFDGAAAGRPYTGLERSRTWPLAEAFIPRQFVSCHPWKGCVPLLLALVTSCTATRSIRLPSGGSIAPTLLSFPFLRRWTAVTR
jgi:hypothetical protein